MAFFRDIHQGYLSSEKVDNNQIIFVNESKNFEKGTKTLERKSFLNKLGLSFNARDNILDNFKSRLLPIISR